MPRLKEISQGALTFWSDVHSHVALAPAPDALQSFGGHGFGVLLRADSGVSFALEARILRAEHCGEHAEAVNTNKPGIL